MTTPTRFRKCRNVPFPESELSRPKHTTRLATPTQCRPKKSGFAFILQTKVAAKGLVRNCYSNLKIRFLVLTERRFWTNQAPFTNIIQRRWEYSTVRPSQSDIPVCIMARKSNISRMAGRLLASSPSSPQESIPTRR